MRTSQSIDFKQINRDGRTFSSDKYRFWFNGKACLPYWQENDNEVKGEESQQDYGMRIYDPRLGRFLSADLLIVYGKMYPELSTYQFVSNTPIEAIDKDGLEAQHINKHRTCIHLILYDCPQLIPSVFY